MVWPGIGNGHGINFGENPTRSVHFCALIPNFELHAREVPPQRREFDAEDYDVKLRIDAGNTAPIPLGNHKKSKKIYCK